MMKRHTEWTEELATQLCEPFTEDEIGYLEKGSEVIPYIPWHQITKRLNEVVGPGGWQEGEPKIEVVNGRLILGGPLTILGVQRYNFGDELISVGEAYEETDRRTGKTRTKTKGYSSAIMSARAQWLRRTAAGFGIGAYLYEDGHPARKEAERIALAKAGRVACPKCGGKVWDNREKEGNWPDFRCRDDGCKYEFQLDAERGTVPSNPKDPRPSRGEQDKPSSTNGAAPDGPREAYNRAVENLSEDARRILWIGHPDLETAKKDRQDKHYKIAAEQLAEYGDKLVGRCRENAVDRARDLLNEMNGELDDDTRTVVSDALAGDPSDASILSALETLYTASRSTS